jgi:hypothetical protein
MPPPLDEGKVKHLVELAECIIGLIHSGKDADSLIRRFNKEAGRSFSKREIARHLTNTDEETFVRETLTPPPTKLPDITYEELLELVTRVCQATGSGSEHEYWLTLLEVNLGNPQLSDLIYWPGEYFGDGDNSREMSPKEILDIALADGLRNSRE